MVPFKNFKGFSIKQQESWLFYPGHEYREKLFVSNPFRSECTRLSWVSVCKINMAAFLWARRLNQSSFLGCFLSNLSFVPESRSLFRLGLYAGDLKSRKQGLLRRDFSTEEVSINFVRFQFGTMSH